MANGLWPMAATIWRQAIGSDFLWLTAAVHLRVDRQRATTHRDDLALESDNVAGKDREFEVDAVEHEKDSVLCVNILCYSKIRTL